MDSSRTGVVWMASTSTFDQPIHTSSMTSGLENRPHSALVKQRQRWIGTAPNPKAGELVAVLQWMTDDQARSALSDDEGVRRQLSDELGDVLIYRVRLADISGIDLDDAVTAKVERNALRYAADEVRGSIEKR